ncbi:MAG: hypothetical protein JEY91_16345, partial [Spirochaetaceae bacterium]|nr:hypothetical protein [Spirochaetaceae bacterium]
MKPEHKKKNSTIFLYSLLLILIITIMILAGFSQKSSQTENSIQWLSENRELQFTRSSFAYTKKFISQMPQSDDELMMEFPIKPIFPERPRFSVLFHIYNRFNDEQIVVGQWNTTLVILNSDDYSNKKREPKIYISLEQDRTIRFITIKSDNSGTSVYIDGELKGENKNLK